MSDLIFSISGDTANGLVEPTLLSGEIISSGLAPALRIETLGDVLIINHTPSLSIPDSGTLVGVVAAHNGIDFSTVDHPGPTGDIIQEAIDVHAADSSAHHIRYTDAEAIAASSGTLDHHIRYTDAEASGVAVQVATTGILEHANIVDVHHARYTDAEAIAASSGALDHHLRYTDAEASGVAVLVATTGILEHTNIVDAHHARYTDAEAIAASSGALDHHFRYTDAEASGVAVFVATTGILEHTNITDAHHARYTDAEAIAASSGALDHHLRYTDAEASGVAVLVATTGILEHTNIIDAHHTRYTDAEAIAASSGALDHHVRYTDAEASGVAVQVATTGILEHTNIIDAHHTRYTDAEAIAAASGALDHHDRYTNAEASGIAVQVVTSGIANHSAITDVHHARYTDAEASGVASGLIFIHTTDSAAHHIRYTDAEAEAHIGGVAGTGIGNLVQIIDVNGSGLAGLPAIDGSLLTGIQSGGVALMGFDYTFKDSTTDSDPGKGNLRFNQINQDITTQIYIDCQDDNNSVISSFLLLAASGDLIIIQERKDATKWKAFDNNADSVLSGTVNDGYVRFTNVDVFASGLDIGNNEDIIVSLIFRTVGTATPTTLQGAYNAATSEPQITLTTDPLTIRDNAAPLSSILNIQNNAGTIDFLKIQGTPGGTQVDIGAHDSLIAGSNEPIIRISDTTSNSFKFWPTNRTFTSSPGSLMLFNNTYEFDYSNNSFAGLNLQATIEIRQSQFPFNGFLLFNNGLTMKNVNGVVANFGPGQTFIAQPVLQADGASISMGQNRDFLSQPTFNTINGGSLSVGTWSGMQLFGQINTGVTMTTRNGIQIGSMIGAGGTLVNERGIRIENLAGRGGSTNIVGIQSAIAGTTKKFIEQLGNSPSTFAGDIHVDNGISLVLGTQAGNRVELLRSGAGTMRMIGQGGTNNEALEWDFDTATANNVEVNSSTNAGLQFNLDAISFGTTAADPTSANWFTIFSAPNLRQPSAGGEYSDVLWTAGGSIDIDGNTMSNVQAFKINSPAVILNGGTIDDLSNLFIDTMPSFGATRYQALRVIGRSRLDGLMTHNEAILSTLTADESSLVLPANNNGRHMILIDADASGPWTIQGVVNDQVGDSVYIMNSGVNDFIIGHQDAGSAANERIVSPTASGITLGQHQMAKLWYNSTISRWNILEHTGT